MKNEKGSSLITVLVIMSVFSIIALSLFSMAFNTAKQVSRTGEDIQATNLAEMAEKQVKEAVYTQINSSSYSQKTMDDIKTSLTNDLSAMFNKDYKIKSTMDYPLYRIEQADVSTTENDTNQNVSIDFTVVGISEKQQRKTITGTIKYTRGIGESFPSKPDLATEVATAMTYDKKNDGLFDQTMYYDNGFTMNSNSSLTYNYDLYVNGTLTQDSNTDLWVKGNAYIKFPYPKTNSNGNGNLGILCVDNTLYVPSDLLKDSNFVYNIVNTNCNSVITGKPVNGIYAKAVEPLPVGNSEIWDQKNITVENIQYK